MQRTSRDLLALARSSTLDTFELLASMRHLKADIQKIIAGTHRDIHESRIALNRADDERVSVGRLLSP